MVGFVEQWQLLRSQSWFLEGYVIKLEHMYSLVGLRDKENTLFLMLGVVSDMRSLFISPRHDGVMEYNSNVLEVAFL